MYELKYEFAFQMLLLYVMQRHQANDIARSHFYLHKHYLWYTQSYNISLLGVALSDI